MGLIPNDEFYPMDIDDFWLKWKGFHDKIVYELELVRRQTAIIYYSQPQYGKGNKPSFERLWPSHDKDKKPSISKARERLKKHREEEALRRWKEKNGTST